MLRNKFLGEWASSILAPPLENSTTLNTILTLIGQRNAQVKLQAGLVPMDSMVNGAFLDANFTTKTPSFNFTLTEMIQYLMQTN